MTTNHTTTRDVTIRVNDDRNDDGALAATRWGKRRCRAVNCHGFHLFRGKPDCSSVWFTQNVGRGATTVDAVGQRLLTERSRTGQQHKGQRRESKSHACVRGYHVVSNK